MSVFIPQLITPLAPYVFFGFEPTAMTVEIPNVTAAAPFMELLIALLPRAWLYELWSGGRCECVSPFPSNRLSGRAYHGSRRGWPLTCGVTPCVAASPGGLRVTLTPHLPTHTHTNIHTPVTEPCTPSEAPHAEVKIGK